MGRPITVLALACLCGCGARLERDKHHPDDPAPDGAEPPGDAAVADAAIGFACPGGTIAPGTNTLTIAGTSRSFLADFPASTARPMGVVFSWHGFGQTAAAFRGDAALDPDANPDLPVVIVTPNDTGLLPPAGLGWDIVDTADNPDLALFEAVLGCLDDQYAIDASQIRSFGFSAGSVMTNLVHARYPHLVRTIVTESGAWFDDPAERALVNFPMPWMWPELVAADGGTVLLTHGGPNDVAPLNVIDLEAAAQAAVPFLAAHGRRVLDCAHDAGHALDPHLTPVAIVQFLTTNRQPVLPASCMLRALDAHGI